MQNVPTDMDALDAHRQDAARIYEQSNLTINQLLMWVEEKLNPEAPVYSLPLTFTINERIHPVHFGRAFQTLVNSSDALSTVIDERDGIPQQRVLEPIGHPMEELDLSATRNPQDELEAWVQRRSQSRFDLALRLFDSVLIKMSEHEFVWYLNVHHIICDSVSRSLILRWMADFYERSLAGDLPKMVSLPAFSAYIDHELAYRRSPRYLKSSAYWERKLAPKVMPLTFYGAGNSFLKTTTAMKRIFLDLGPERTRRLKDRATDEGIFWKTFDVTLFNIFGSVLYAYLHLMDGNRYLSIGAPFHNRRSKTFAETIGMFVEVHPLRVTIEDGETFVSLIKKAADEAVETLAHSGCCPPFVNRNTYDVLLNFFGSPDTKFRDARVKVREHIEQARGHCSLALTLFDSSSDVYELAFDFHLEVFDDTGRNLVMRQLLRVLDAFLEDPTQPLHRISLLSDAEKEHILVDFNRTRTRYRGNKTLAQLFESQVAKCPDRVALAAGDDLCTYAGLNSRANQLAHQLRRLGVGPEVCVGICMERSIDMVVGLLGILKAGGAYVPLDPAYPKERLAFMIRDSRIGVLLTQTSLQGSVSFRPSAFGLQPSKPKPNARHPKPEIVCLDGQWPIIEQQSSANLPNACSSENLAYVIYTSGSTGAPKGAAITQHSAATLLQWAKGIFDSEDLAGVLAATSICFDLSVFELFVPLSWGGRVILADNALVNSPTDITLINTVPSVMVELLETKGLPASVRTVNLAGEPLHPYLVEQIYDQGTVRRVFDLYGPTEDTTYSTFALRSREGPATIGRPIANTRTYIVQPGLDPVPLGIKGDLYIGGEGLARAYLDRPELTAERFIPDAFAHDPGDRLYKTGDLARYFADGNIEFLGRLDQQVKVRGFRIELGEIEAVLGQHPAVRQTVVVARGRGTGDRGPGTGARRGERPRPDTRHRTPDTAHLVAYVVAREECVPSTGELRAFLAKKLPEYMVPQFFVVLHELPLTANGKLDRKALPEREAMRTALEQAYVGPGTEAEELLAGIWREVLGLERVGIHDNFFELGGHSLLATQVISRMRRTFGIDLPLRVCFEAPTIAGLAESIDTIHWATNTPEPDPRSSHNDTEDSTF